jgi:hypothetical protein
MTTLAIEQHQDIIMLRASGPDAVGFPTPDQIRASIQQLVVENDLDQAQSLAEEGLSVYPESEGVLAIAGLLAIVRQNWDQAVDLLGRLLELQGERASEFARMMYERAINCGGKASVPQRAALAATIE